MKPLLTSLLMFATIGLALPAEAQRPRYYRGYYDYAPRRAVRVVRPRFEFYYTPAPRYRSYYRPYAPYARGYSYYSYPSYGYAPRPRGPVFYDRDDWEDYREDMEERREDYEEWLEDRQEEYEERMEDWRDRFDD